MREQATKGIAGHTYAVTQLPARQAERLFVRLVRLFGPMLVGVLGGALTAGIAEAMSKPTGKPKESDGKGLAEMEIGPALLGFFDRLSEADFDYLRDKLFELMTVDGRPVLGDDYDIRYQGRLFEVLQAMWFALEANYGFSSGAVLSAFTDRASSARAAPASISPTT